MDPHRTYPLTHHQRLLWLSQQIHAGLPLYHIAISYRIRGPLDARRFGEAVAAAVEQVDALRTVIRTGADGEPEAVVLPEMAGGHAYLDFPGHTDSFDEHLQADLWEPFNAADRLFDSRLYRLGEEDYSWLLRMHHVISDGVSFRLIFERVEALYLGREDFPAAPSYFSYAQSGKAEPAAADRAFWQSRLPDLAGDFNFYGRSPGTGAHSTERYSTVFDRTRLQKIDALAPPGVSRNAQRFNFFAAVHAVCLARLSGSPNPSLAMVYHGRSDPTYRRTAGFLTRMLPLRIPLDQGDSLLAVMEKLGAESARAVRHASGAITNNRLQQIIQTSVNLRISRFETFAGIPVETTSHHSEWNELPLVLNIHTFREEQIEAALDISRQLLPEDVLRREAADRLFRMLDAFLEDPNAPIREAPLLTAAERTQLLQDFQPARAPVPEDGIAGLFETRAAARPEDAAFIFGGETLTFGALNRAANRAAHKLVDAAGRSAEPIGIHLGPGLLLTVAVLAAVKAGRPHLMLPPGLPEERRTRMIAESGVRCVLAGDAVDPLPGVQTLRLSGILSDDTLPDHNPGRPLGIDEALYIVYTSGSTGKPKGIRVPQRQLLNLLVYRWKQYPLGPEEVLCHKSYPGFVDSTIELFEGLLQGRPTVLLDEATIRDPEALVAALARRHVSRTRFIPEHLATLIESVPQIGERLPDLALIANTAAQLRPDQLSHFTEAFPGRIFINTFGLSELVGVTLGQIEPGDAAGGRMPLGRPIENRQVYILDPFLEPVPVGVPGELYLGGDDLPLGYVGEEAGRLPFVPHPFGSGDLFRTGDLAAWRTDGRVEYLGRRDQQVKVRGQRVELAEIESALEALPGIRGAVVNAVERSGRTLLAAHLLPDGEPPGTEALQEALARRLPDYMVPAFFQFHDTFPHTASGKIDRNALPAPTGDARDLDTAAPENPTEARLVEIWEEFLGVTGIGRHSDFIALGGESLLAMRIRARIAREFDVQVPAAAFVDAPTIAKQARLVAEARRGLPLDQCLIPIRGSGDRPPIFLVPPAGATVLTFGRLVHHLPGDLPVYGLQPWGIEGEVRPHYSVPRMAADYIREMRRVHPEGPYLMAGMCFGGIVVFEMARQLARAGAPPDLVVVLDTLLPPNMPAGKRLFGLARLAKRFALRQWSMPEDVIQRLAAQSPSGRLAERELKHIDLVYRANAVARYFYRASRYPRKLDVVFSGAAATYGNREDWQLAAQEVAIHHVPGHHAGDKSILREPFVRALAAHLAGLVERALG